MKKKLIFIPGLGATGDMWEHQITHLQDIADCEVFIPNKPNLYNMVEDLFNSVEGQFSIVGSSLGGWVGQAASAYVPERIQHLVLMDTWTSSSMRAIHYLDLLLQNVEKNDPQQILDGLSTITFFQDHPNKENLIERLKAMHPHCHRNMLINQLQAMIDDHETLHLLKKIKAHTLIIKGKYDIVYEESEFTLLNNNIKDSKYVVVENAAHCASMEQPEEVTMLIRNWIS